MREKYGRNAGLREPEGNKFRAIVVEIDTAHGLRVPVESSQTLLVPVSHREWMLIKVEMKV